jgi:hypothetical protein
MHFVNFALERAIQAITLHGLGVEWDLHNFADLVGIRFDPGTAILDLEWRVPPNQANPWGSPLNLAVGCILRCAGVSALRIRFPGGVGTRDVAGVSRVDPEESTYRFKSEWRDDDESNLLVELEGGAEIEVAADTVELVSILGEQEDRRFRAG